MTDFRAIRYSSCDINNGIAPSTYRQSSDFYHSNVVTEPTPRAGPTTLRRTKAPPNSIAMAQAQSKDNASRAKRSLRDRFSKRTSHPSAMPHYDSSLTSPLMVSATRSADEPSSPTYGTADCISLDVARAISLLQSLRINATPAEIQALHRALLPTKEDEALHCSANRNPDSIRPYNAGRRGSDLPAGVATRINVGNDSLRRREHPALRNQLGDAEATLPIESSTPMLRSRDSIAALDLARTSTEAPMSEISPHTRHPPDTTRTELRAVDTDRPSHGPKPETTSAEPEARTLRQMNAGEQEQHPRPQHEKSGDHVSIQARDEQKAIGGRSIVTRQPKPKSARFTQRWSQRAMHLSREYTSECLPEGPYAKNDAADSLHPTDGLHEPVLRDGLAPSLGTPASALSLWEQSRTGNRPPSIVIDSVTCATNFGHIAASAKKKTDSGYESRLSMQSTSQRPSDASDVLDPTTLNSHATGDNRVDDDGNLCTFAEMLRSSHDDLQSKPIDTRNTANQYPPSHKDDQVSDQVAHVQDSNASYLPAIDDTSISAPKSISSELSKASRLSRKLQKPMPSWLQEKQAPSAHTDQSVNPRSSIAIDSTLVPEGNGSPSTLFEKLMIEHAESPPTTPELNQQEHVSAPVDPLAKKKLDEVPSFNVAGLGLVSTVKSHSRAKSVSSKAPSISEESGKKKSAFTRLRSRTIGSYKSSKASKSNSSLPDQSTGNLPTTSSPGPRPISIANFGFPLSVPSIPSGFSQRPLSIPSRHALVRGKSTQGMDEAAASEFARMRSRDVAGGDLIPLLDIPRIAVPKNAVSTTSNVPDVANPAANDGHAIHQNQNSTDTTSRSSDTMDSRLFSDSIPPMPNIPADVVAKASKAEERAMRKLQGSTRSSPELSCCGSLEPTSKRPSTICASENLLESDRTGSTTVPKDSIVKPAGTTLATDSPQSLSSAQWEQEAREWRERRKSVASNRMSSQAESADQTSAPGPASDKTPISTELIQNEACKISSVRVRAFHRPILASESAQSSLHQVKRADQPSSDLSRPDSANSGETFYSASSRSKVPSQRNAPETEMQAPRNISPLSDSASSTTDHYCVSPIANWARSPEGALAALEGNVSPTSSLHGFHLGEAHHDMHDPIFAATPRSPRTRQAEAMFDRYSGGLEYNWDRKFGFDASAGTRTSRRNSPPYNIQSGLDLRDVPQLVPGAL